MSTPSIPNIDSKINLATNEASNVVLASISFEELDLVHIINAEGEKIQSYLGTLEGQEVKRDKTKRIRESKMEFSNSFITINLLDKQLMLLKTL